MLSLRDRTRGRNLYIGLVLHRHRCKHKLIVMLSALAITSLSYSIIHVYRRGGIDIMYLFMPLNRKLCIVDKSQHCVPFIYEARGRYLSQGYVITSRSLLWDIITYPCLRYLLLATKSTYVSIWVTLINVHRIHETLIRSFCLCIW